VTINYGSRVLLKLSQILIVILCASPVQTAFAQGSGKFHGKWFCTEDAVAGVSYNEAYNKWESTHFRTGKRLLLNVSFLENVKHDLLQKMIGTYKVTLSPHGSDDKDTCYTQNPQLKNTNPFANFIFDNSGWISCDLMGGELKVNLTNGRFLKSYTFGYTDGVDNNENTPGIAIGVCTRIE
jgi:hypothetical protein